jgi:hypothetical protein
LHTAVIRLAMPDAATADRAARSLQADNDASLVCKTEGATLVLTARSGAILGVMRSLDDAFDGLRVAGLLR